MKQIKITVKDKIACLVDPEQFLVCDNSDYEVVFDFDSDWANVSVKTALFVFADEAIAIPFVDNVCEGIAVRNATLCAIGVFSGQLKTTTGATIRCVPTPKEWFNYPKPSPETYDKIIELLNRYINAVKGAPSGGSKGQVLKKNSDEDYDYSWQDDEKRDLSNYYTKLEVDEKFATPEIVKEKIDEYFKENPIEDGVSPTITITPIENGHRVTITDIDGIETFDILDGKNGLNGTDGRDGEDGYTPQKGIDYWNDSDISEIHKYVDEQVSPLMEEINGVEQELQMINEGGVE